MCNERWLIGTPDYVDEGVLHEAKQTKKSQRRGIRDAPWWIEQLATYLLFQRRTRREEKSWGRIVANYIMGDYGEKRKGFRPRPPTSELEASRVVFPSNESFWAEWEGEVLRRKQIVEGDERPLLSFPGDPLVDNPRYTWECPSCPVGKVGECPNWRWDDEDREIIAVEETKEVEDERG